MPMIRGFTCSFCGGYGHRRNTCKHVPKGKCRCSICGELGHNRAGCPKSDVVSYLKWESSHDKWYGDLWSRLDTVMKEAHLKRSNVTYRKDAWIYLLGHQCAYCDKYMDTNIDVIRDFGIASTARPCLKCPLFSSKTCSDNINEYHTIGRLYKKWYNWEKSEFIPLHQELLRELVRTKFAD